MFNEPNRNHWTFLIGGIVKLFKELFFILIIAMFNISEGGIFVIVAIAIVALIGTSISWYNTKYYIDEEELVYMKGIIGKKKIEIPFDKINTIDIKKTVIDKIFNVCTVKIDSGAMEDGQEIKLKITLDEALEFKKEILKLKKEENANDDKVAFEGNVEEKVQLIKRTITFKELALYAVTKGKLIWAMGAFFVGMQFLQQAEEMLETGFIDDVINHIDINYFSSKNIVALAIFVVGMFVLCYLLISVIFLIYESIRLYNFTISSDGKNIYISYGLLTSKEYSIPIEKVHALRYKQGALQQWLGVYNLEAVTIGYGDEENEKAILYPIADKKFMNETIKLLLPDLVSEGDIITPPKRAISRFVIKRNIILLVFVLPIALFIINDYVVQDIVAILVLVSINSILGYINYRNTSLSFNEKTIFGSSGSLLKISTIIKQSSVQSIEIKHTPFSKRKRVFDVKIDIYSNKLGESVQVKNIDESIEEKISRSLIL